MSLYQDESDTKFHLFEIYDFQFQFFNGGVTRVDEQDISTTLMCFNTESESAVNPINRKLFE